MTRDRTDLTHVSTHFQFGENWANFANALDPAAVTRAEADLSRLIPDQEEGPLRQDAALFYFPPWRARTYCSLRSAVWRR